MFDGALLGKYFLENNVSSSLKSAIGNMYLLIAAVSSLVNNASLGAYQKNRTNLFQFYNSEDLNTPSPLEIYPVDQTPSKTQHGAQSQSYM